ncbi:MAG: hypothetical protein HYY04_09210, partial [Chloroflexi bacterium]|nr:hypothetical protein [Chloroflexota bacterium]
MAQETPVEVVNQPKGCLARLRRIVLIVAIVYVMAGLVTALSFSFFAGGGLGPR